MEITGLFAQGLHTGLVIYAHIVRIVLFGVHPNHQATRISLNFPITNLKPEQTAHYTANNTANIATEIYLLRWSHDHYSDKYVHVALQNKRGKH